MEEKREIKTSERQEKRSWYLTPASQVQVASRPLKAEGQERAPECHFLFFFFHLKKGRLYSENTAEPELEPEFPGSKSCEINSPKVLSLRLKKKTFFFLFLCPKPYMYLQTPVLAIGSEAVYWEWGCSKGHIDSGGLSWNPLVVTTSVVDMLSRLSAQGC